MDEVEARLRRGLVESLALPLSPDEVPRHGLLRELGLDSVASLEYLIWVEGEFGIQIDDDDLSVDLVDDLTVLADYVRGRVGASPRAGDAD